MYDKFTGKTGNLLPEKSKEINNETGNAFMAMIKETDVRLFA